MENPPIDKPRKNAVAIICAIVVIVAIIAGVILAISLNHSPTSESQLAASLQLVDKQWSKHTPWFQIPYVTVTASLFNSGGTDANAAAVTIQLFDKNNVLLETETIPIGSVPAKDYVTFKNNINYAGTVDHINWNITY